MGEADAVRLLIKEIRQECVEERTFCSNAVELLHKREQQQQQQSSLLQDRACSPSPDCSVLDLTRQLELCMRKARDLEAENKAIRSQREHEAEQCRDAVEHLRAKVRR